MHQIYLVDIGDVGRHSDGGVFSNSLFGQALEEYTLCIPDALPLPDKGTVLAKIHEWDQRYHYYLFRHFTATSLRHCW